MAEFVIELNEDNTVKSILRDGLPDDRSKKFEQVFSVVRVYFHLAKLTLNQFRSAEDNADRRALGIQAFVMSLAGLEAFANTCFHLRARELKRPDLEILVTQNRSTLAQKFRELIRLIGDPEMRNQEELLNRIFQLSALRNAIMHPRWAPSSVSMNPSAPIIIEGLVENLHSEFEDPNFCRESLFWCLLVIARLSEARGDSSASGSLFHWTGNYGLTLQMILEQLQISE